MFPWAFVWGYAAKAVERGVVLRTHTSVVRVEPLAQGFALHLHTGEVVRARRVVNATGAWSGALNRQLGIDLPNRPHRHEILSSEPLKPFLDPLVVDLSSGLYFSQSTRGELVTGISLPDAPDGSDESLTLHSSLRFLTHLSATLTRLMPITAAMKVLRQWVGPYERLARRRRDRRPEPRPPRLHPGVRLHRARLHDGARGGSVARALARPRRGPPDAGALVPGSLRRRGRRPPRGHDHRLTRRDRPRK
ncbi:NAD(P)/FAD-dependent oxidoreductase [Nannocystis pusilla]|uniref:NAD(P)/FAD-dependent oxidoreductase n=1 Tax=Nannocystis pusilla TaxID=889268 RepID=UPI003DA4A7DB